MKAIVDTKLTCFHCGQDCNDKIHLADKIFCCQGCKTVYQLLNQHALCTYYDLNDNPGINKKIEVRKDKFAFLDDEKIQQKLISFANDEQTHVTLYLPVMHCSSCLYLLESLHKIDANIVASTVNFPKKELDVVFNNKTTLRKVAELLTAIGYEPYISLNNLQFQAKATDKKMIYQLGIAGFCFANIMLLSFPEYLGLDASDANLLTTFHTLNILLALPVFFYSAQSFYTTAWKGLQHRFLNIDAPIALAIIITFSRSLYEVFTGKGPGYFDSMTGIVFFMLIGRVLQDKIYRQLSFERDYTSYFPVAVTVLKDKNQVATALPDINKDDTLLIHQEELIPADGILTRGSALIDYSFVTGESLPVIKEMGEIVYAGGKQMGGNIEVLVMREVSQSYLTSLWSKQELAQNKEKHVSFVHLFSRYFTYILLSVTAATALYWSMHDATKVWSALTATLIIACPCALLLSNTFTNGNVLRILAKHKFYLRTAQVIEDIASTNHIVFDKTGTLTSTGHQNINYAGQEMTIEQKQSIALLASQSIHPLSRMLLNYLDVTPYAALSVDQFIELPGKGIEGWVNNNFYQIGSQSFVEGNASDEGAATTVFVACNGQTLGRFDFENNYRNNIESLMKQLQESYGVSIVSGDNAAEEDNLRQLTNNNAVLLFHQKPEDKLEYIKILQRMRHNVMMIGDGLNDGIALRASNVGIAVAEDCNNFTPSSDAIIEAKQLPLLNRFIKLCKGNKKIVVASFILSIMYNIVGLSFAVQGNLSPVIAAILMPASSISILLLTFGGSNMLAKMLRL